MSVVLIRKKFVELIANMKPTGYNGWLNGMIVPVFFHLSMSLPSILLQKKHAV